MNKELWTGQVHVTSDIYQWWRWIAPYPCLALDTETTGLEWDARIITIQACGDDEIPYILDCRSMNHQEYGSTLDAILDGKDLILHNAKFDLGKLLVNFGYTAHKPGEPCRLYDTMIAEQVLYNGKTQKRPQRKKDVDQTSMFSESEWERMDRSWYDDERLDLGDWAEWLPQPKRNAYSMPLPMGLGPVVERYLGIHLEKGLATSFAHTYGDWTNEQLLYMAHDVVYLHRIAAEQRKQAHLSRLDHIIELECSILMPLTYMEVKGFHIDLQMWSDLTEQKREELQRTRKNLQNMLAPAAHGIQVSLFDVVDTTEEDADEMAQLLGGIKDPLLSSPKKLKVALNRLLPTDAQLTTTDKNVLKTMTRFPLIDALLAYRAVEEFFKKFASTYPSMVDRHSFLHPNYRQLVRSGRMACFGPNLQQVPHDPAIRMCFTAPPGYVMIVADFSQAELRILADVSQAASMLRAYREGLDLHILTAVRMINLEHPEPLAVYTDVGKKHPKRLIAKTTGFSVVYQIGSTKLALRLSGETKTDISKDEAQMFTDAWFEEFPEAKVWIKNTARKAARDGYVRTQLGRIRYSGILADDPDIENLQNKWSRQAPNTIIQGGNADATKRAIATLWNTLDQYGAWICGVVHDEIVVYAPEEYGEAVRTLVKTAMERGGDFVQSITMEAEAVVSDAWEKPG